LKTPQLHLSPLLKGPCLLNLLHAQPFILGMTGIQTEEDHAKYQEDEEAKQILELAHLLEDGLIEMTSFDSPFPETRETSVLVIGLHGLITDDPYYGTITTTQIAALLDLAADDPMIAGVVLSMESPGGSAYGLYEITDKLLAFKDQKPLITHYNKMGCSAAVALGSCGTESYVNHARTITGSIGAAISFLDIIPFFESVGFKYHYVNAPQNPDKNKPIEDLRQGKPEAIQEMLAAEAAHFHAHVKMCRPSMTNDEAFTGKTFNGTEALAFGLVHGIASLEECVARCLELHHANSNNP